MTPCSEEGRWRDLLPLPLLKPEFGRAEVGEFFKESACVRKHRARREANVARTNEVIHALNFMAGFPEPCAMAPTPNQARSQANLLCRVARLPRSRERVFQREAISELLLESPASPYVSGEGGSGSVRAYQRDLVSLPEAGAAPLDATDLLDQQGREILNRFESSMFVGEEGTPAKTIKPYMDETLKLSPKAYADFIVDIFERGMIDFARTATSTITPFFVSKKSGKLRLVLDCRASNMYFAKPPDIALAAGYTFAQLEIPDGEQLYVAQSDVRDYFYSIGLPPGLRGYFALPPIAAHMLPPGLVDPSEVEGGMTHPRMKVVPMGWSWAMWIAQRIHQHQAALAVDCSPDQVLVDGRPPPDLQAGSPVMIPYADNLNVCGTCKVSVQRAKDKVVQRLRDVGFRVHEEEDAALHAQALGFIIDGERGQVHPIPARRDRVRLCLLWLAKRPKISGRAIERIIGHCVHLFMLRRDLLAIFRSVYDFKIACYNKPCKLWKSAAEECRVAAALILTCYADLRKPWSNNITVSDACLSGTAVAALEVDSHSVQNVGRCREMWRFKSKDPLSRARDAALSLDPFVHHETVLPMSHEERDPFQLNLEFQHVPLEIACSPEWKVQFASRMTKPEHITLLEGRGTVQAIRHKMRVDGNFGKKHVHLGDNLGMVLAFDRGRAKSVPLLLCCRRATAFAIAGDAVFTHRWLPSEHNAADAASRQWEGERAETTVCKSKAQEIATAICYPKGGGKISQKTCKEFLRRSVGGTEECSAAALPGCSPYETQPAQSSASPRRGIEGSEASSCCSTGEPAEEERRPHVPRDSGGGAPDQRGVPAQVEPLRVVLQNTEVEAAKRGRCGLCIDDLSQPSFFGRLGCERRCQDHSSCHRPKARSGGKARATSGETFAARMAKPGPRSHTPPAGLANHCAHRIDCSDEQSAGRGNCLPLHVCHVRATGGGVRVATTGPGQERGAGAAVVSEPASLRGLAGVKGGGQQRDFAFRQQRNPVAWSSARMHHGHLFRTASPNQLHGGTAGVGAVSSGTQAGRKVRSPVPAASLWRKLGPLQAVSQPVGGQATRQMGIRQQPEEIRTACLGRAAVRQTEPSTAAKSPRGTSCSQGDGPLKMWPAVTKVQKPFLEVFSGCARLSRACAERGIPSEAWDVLYGPSCNLLHPSVSASLLERLRKREFCAVHLGLPCTSWSLARRFDGRGPAPLRSDESLMGLPNLKASDKRKVAQSNQLLEFALRVIEICQQLRVPWTLENPQSSRLWLVPAVRQLLLHGATKVEASFCAYGMPWRKATTFLAGNFSSLRFLTCNGSFRQCSRTGAPHLPLVGKSSSGAWLTGLAQPYPEQLCEHFALQLLYLLKHTPRSDMGG